MSWKRSPEVESSNKLGNNIRILSILLFFAVILILLVQIIGSSEPVIDKDGYVNLKNIDIDQAYSASANQVDEQIGSNLIKTTTWSYSDSQGVHLITIGESGLEIEELIKRGLSEGLESQDGYGYIDNYVEYFRSTFDTANLDLLNIYEEKFRTSNGYARFISYQDNESVVMNNSAVMNNMVVSYVYNEPLGKVFEVTVVTSGDVDSSSGDNHNIDKSSPAYRYANQLLSMPQAEAL